MTLPTITLTGTQALNGLGDPKKRIAWAYINTAGILKMLRDVPRRLVAERLDVRSQYAAA